MTLSLRIIFPGLVFAGLWLGAESLRSTSGGATLSFSLLIGAVFGIVLQRARFCFFCNLRDFLESGDPRGALSILMALGVGAVGYTVIFGAWLPVPVEGRLPPTAHIGPVSPALALAAFVFGVGMTISGSCLSAHLYRLGEGSPTAPFALLGAVLGFAIGFMTWNPIYLALVSEGSAVWLPHSLGYAGTLAITLSGLVVLALLALWRSMPLPISAPYSFAPRDALRAVFVDRWPTLIGGAAVGVISAVAYFRVAPLGVTAELGSIARTGAAAAGIAPETLFGLDGFRGCATAIKQTLLSKNGAFIVGLIGGSFASAILAGQFTPQLPTLAQIRNGLTGGVLMGWSAMTALGCTVGVLLSGIHAGALAGWVFFAFCAAGVALSLWMKRRD
ncbi:MAG: YeeE/YedE family protein [Chitinophagales bacterium]|nr:YeeE/YedE family protein [Hyphomicrobiales bacterium]